MKEIIKYIIWDKEEKAPVIMLIGTWGITPQFTLRRDAKQFMEEQLENENMEIVKVSIKKIK